MTNPIVQTLVQEIAATREVMSSAVALLRDIDARVRALENGATEQELAPLYEAERALESSRGNLADAVATTRAQLPGSEG